MKKVIYSTDKSISATIDVEIEIYKNSNLLNAIIKSKILNIEKVEETSFWSVGMLQNSINRFENELLFELDNLSKSDNLNLYNSAIIELNKLKYS